MLVSFFTRLYRELAEFFCWILLIGAAIGMGILFDGNPVVGGIVGLVAAFALELTFLPPIMVLFEINDKLEMIGKKIDKNNKNDNAGSSKAADERVSKVADEKSAYPKSNTWVCKKCGETNPEGAMLCRSCGR